MEQVNNTELCYNNIAQKFSELVDREIDKWVWKAVSKLTESKDKLCEKYKILCKDEFSEAKGTFDIDGYSISSHEFFKIRGYIKALESNGERLGCYQANDPAIRGGSLYPCATIKKVKEADKAWSACICLDETGEYKYCDYKNCLSSSKEERETEHKKSLIRKIADKQGFNLKDATYKSLPLCGKLKYLFSKKKCKYCSEIKDDSAFYGNLVIDGITKRFLEKLIDEASKLNVTFDSIMVRIGESTKTTTKARGFYTFELKNGQLTDEKIPVLATSSTRMFSIKGKNVFASYDPFMEISYTLKSK